MNAPTRPSDPLCEPTARASRWDYPIDASMSTHEGVGIILDALLRVMIGAEQGVLGARDADALHDYRVALRRTRSALSLFGELLAPPVRRRGRKLFKDLGRRTTAARDLDVLLLAMPGYTEDLAPAERAGLGALESRIAQRRDREYDMVCRRLGSDGYRSELSSWHADLEQLAASSGEERFTERAIAAIRDAAGRIEGLAVTLGSENPGAALHRLRIRYKKLRYALEFAAALTPGGQIEAVIARLKALQDQLGEHQDLLVHGQLIAELGGSDAAARRLAEELAKRRRILREAIEAQAPALEAKLADELDRALETG